MLQVAQYGFGGLITIAVLLIAVLFAEQPLRPNVLAQDEDRRDESVASPPTSIAAAPAELPAAVVVVNLISVFELITPSDQQECKKSDPWTKGELLITNQEALPNDGCFSIRVQAAEDLLIHLLAYSADNGLVRLLPNGCNAMGSQAQAQLGKDQIVNLPLSPSGSRGALGFNPTAGQEWVYLIVSRDAHVHQNVGTALQSVQDVCSDGTGKAPQSDIEQQLTKLQQQFPTHLQWQVKSLNHE